MNIVENIWDSIQNSVVFVILVQKQLRSINEQDYSDSMVKSILKIN